PPVITDPTDPTHSEENLVRVAGLALAGATIRITDESTSAEVGQLTAHPTIGTFDSFVTLADGWHKLVFRQEGDGRTSDPSPPVYVSVKVPPPVVTSPLTGTSFVGGSNIAIQGQTTCSESACGRVYVAEEACAPGLGVLNPGGWSLLQSVDG